MKNRNIYGNISGYGPFDRLRKKRTGSIYDATTRYGGKIDLPAIAGVVEAGRRTNRKAGETNENRIEEAAERLDARARSVAGNESYGGPKFNAAAFAKENNIDMNLRFDPKYERPDQIVANPPRRVTPPKPKPTPAEILYPNDRGPRKAAPTQPTAPRAVNKQVGAQKLTPAQILYPNDKGPRLKTQVAAGKQEGGRKLSPAEILYPNDKGRRDSVPALSGASGNDKLIGGAGNDTLPPAGTLTGMRNKGNNVPALGAEATAAYKRELNAAREAAEARGEQFDVAEFFKTHGEPMIERAKAARAIKEAGEERKRGEKMEPEYFESLAASFLRGLGVPASAISQHLAITVAQERLRLMNYFDRIDQGEDIYARAAPFAAASPQGQGFNDPTLKKLSDYHFGDAEKRAELRNEIGALETDPREMEIYRIGVDIQETLREALRVDPKYGDDFFHNVASGLGEGIPLLVIAIVTRGAAVPEMIAAAGLGAAVKSAERFEEVLNAGASLKRAFEEADMAARFGLAEGLPIVRILDRLGPAPKEIIERALAEGAKGGIDALLKSALADVLEELTASPDIEYDKEKGVFKSNFKDDAATFTVGDLFATLSALVIGGTGVKATK